MRGGCWKLLLVVMAVAAAFAVPVMAQTFFDDFEDVTYRHGAFDCSGYPDQTGAEAAGWVFEAPWKLVDECEFWGEVPAGLLPFDGSTIQAAYCGYLDPDAGTGSYEGIPADDPTLSSAVITLGASCDYIIVKFDYYRQVESDPGHYDRTEATIAFDGGAEQQIFSMDSSDPSVDAWQTFTSQAIATGGAATAQVFFHFEAVDSYNNDFVGWLIDEVDLTCYQEIPTVSWCNDPPSSLPQGEAGTKYIFNEQTPSESGFDFKNYVCGGYVDSEDADGEPDWRFQLAMPDETGEDCPCRPLGPRDPWPLPDRLTLSEDGWLQGNIEADEAGTFTFWVIVEVGSGRDYSCACRKFTLAIRSGGTGDFYETFAPVYTWSLCGFETQAPTVNLWHETDALSCSEPSLAGYGDVAYFGDDGDCDYDTGKRVKGCYCVSVDENISMPEKAGYEIIIGFKSYREVEYYAGGAYDKTYVEVSVDNRATWHTVPDLYWDSNDLSTLAWTWQEASTGMYTTAANTVDIRFCFDSVDGYGNDFFGWAIDEVTVWLEPAPLAVNCCPLPEGFVGEAYSAELTYTGGTCTETIRVIGLPEGLSVECASPCEIVGTPRAAGTFPVTIEVLSGTEVVASADCDLVIHDQRCFFFEDFEADPTWTWGGLWKRIGPPPALAGVPAGEFAGTPPCDPTEIPVGAENHVAYYGNPTTMNYDTGDRTTGALALLDLPAGISIQGADYIDLSFQSCRRVEQFEDGYDRTKVQIRWDTSGTWYTVWYKDSGDKDGTGWQDEKANNGVAFAVPEGATKMWVRFVFDSVDRWYNNYFGWMVDNIKICWAETGGPIDSELSTKGLVDGRDGAGLTVMNVPNPVRDVHTTMFTVRGMGVEAIRIQIFDLNETLVFEEEIEGDELIWHTDNKYGEYLANGVYFYRAYAKINGIWVPTKFQKLVILR